MYLLDRAAEPGYRVGAFKKAADVLRQLDPADVEARAKNGRLTDLDHIGESTARVVSEALRGEVPGYLAKLEAKGGLPATDQARALRSKLKGDCHLHSNWSDGGADIEAMAHAAMAIGHEYLVLTDHSPRLTVAHGLNRERLLRQLDELDRLNAELAPFRILSGLEVDILEDGTLDCDDDLLARLDVVVASVHSKLRMDRQKMTERMVLAVASPQVDILGHCTGRLIDKRPASVFDADLVFAACAQFGTAVELNCRPERLDPPDELVAVAMDYGCRFVVDSDAHAPGQLEWQIYGCEKAVACGIEESLILNTQRADDLLAWAGSARGAW